MSHDELPGLGHFKHEAGSEMSHQAYGVDGPPSDSHILSASTSGRFKCPHPACDKSFTRQEHLSRHKLNHWPKEIFKCSYVFPNTGLACNRTFVRKDLLARHVKRHTKMGGRLQSNSTSIGDFLPRSQSTSSITTPPTTGAAGSAPPNLLPPQHVQFTNFGPSYQSPMNENPSVAPDRSQSSYQNLNRQQDYYPTQNNSDSRNKNNNGQNVNQFFNWLFENGNGSTGQPHNGYAANERNPINASSLPTTAAGMPNKQLPQPNNSPTTQSFSPNSYQVYGFAQSGSPQSQPQGPQLPQAPKSQQGPSGAEALATPASVTKMQDLFSIDFLSNDPLQTFMQELAETKATSQDNNLFDKENIGSSSVSPSLSESALKNNSKLQKFSARRCSMKDNLLVQKSNIDELQKQTENDKISHRYKQRVLFSMKTVPSFFHADPKTKYNFSQEKSEELYDIIPELREVPMDNLKKSLRSFWSNFHTQYGLLHKPSFHIDEQPPILILAMIMVGASFLESDYRETISDIICAPLRWIIFSHDDFQPPSKTYIIQSLLLVEGYEKTCTNRYLHERSYLHHGTTIQLLRRTPSLGGHPLILKTEEKPNGWQDPEQVYRQWIDFEMLKRVAFYAFYMDTTHAVVFGYLNLFINCNQIQLTLPCSDIVWESYDLSYETLLEYGFEKEPKTFLSALKQLMGEAIQTLQNVRNPLTRHQTQELKNWDMKSTLGKKVLLAGIISTMFQCQESNEGDLFATTIKCNLGMGNENMSWQDIFSFALDYWLYQIQGSCTEANDCFIDCARGTLSRGQSQEPNLPKSDYVNSMGADVNTLGRINDPGCKIPEYHMAQVILRIFHYDYYIYGGAPWRMNVRSGIEEYDLVSRRILQFASDTKTGSVAMVYAYQLLFEMFIDRETGSVANKSYNVNSDYCITRPNTIALLALLVWSYNFALYGPETSIWINPSVDDSQKDLQMQETGTTDDAAALSNKKLKDEYIPKEPFEEYLARMYRVLNVETSSTDPISYHHEILRKAQMLASVPGTNHLCGMMKFMKEIFENGYWDLGREFAKLFDNCFERCLGKSSPTCESMYKV